MNPTDETLEPTDEQSECLAFFRLGMTLCVQAGAGTGKTSTLKLMAGSTRRFGQYTAFNRDIVRDAAESMPPNVACATAHSLAFRAVGRAYAHRLDSKRMRSADVARMLGIDRLTVRYGSQVKNLAPGYLASLAQRAVQRFCQTADLVPGPEHVPYVEGIDVHESVESDGDGPPLTIRGTKNNVELREHLAKPIAKAWDDLRDPGGSLRFSPDHYFKIWQLSEPRIHGDFIMLDEAQDASPVMLDVIERQDSQRVYVGDSQQAIYAWRGAVDALASIPTEATAYLTRSWRFGPPIAHVANLILDQLDASLRLEGCDRPSLVAPIRDEPDAVLCRSNAQAVKTLLDYQTQGVSAHLVGGGDEVLRFANGVDELTNGGWTSHPELACFTSYDEVQDYVDQDPQGSDLALMVSLVDEFGTDVIVEALTHLPGESNARVIVSTAHKAKGREWGRVRIAGDFQEPSVEHGAEEWRLLYVAATRARDQLDLVRCDPLDNLTA